MAKNIKNRKYSAEDVVVNDDFSYVSPADGKTYTMTLKERLFCEAFLDFKGDGVDAVYEAGYNPKNSMVAASLAHENLRKPNLIAYINSKLEEYGFNDDNVEKQHLFLLNQSADLKTKSKAVDMFYQLKGKYAPVKTANVNVNVSAKTNNPELEEIRKQFNDKVKEKVIDKIKNENKPTDN